MDHFSFLLPNQISVMFKFPANVPHDRTEKRPRPAQMQSSMITAKKPKMASFSRSAVYAVVGRPMLNFMFEVFP